MIHPYRYKFKAPWITGSTTGLPGFSGDLLPLPAAEHPDSEEFGGRAINLDSLALAELETQGARYQQAARKRQGNRFKPMYRRRRLPRRRRSFKRTRAYTRRPNVGRIALRKIMQLERNEEKKYQVDTAASFNCAAAVVTWSRAALGPLLSQGDTSATRSGIKVTVKDLSLRITLNAVAAMPLGGQVRLVLTWDRRPAGALATATSLFTADSFFSPLNVVGISRGRYQVIFDRVFNFQGADVRASDTFYWKGNLQTQFNGGNTGLIGDVDKGVFILWAAGNNNVQVVSVDYGFRIRFTDD